MLLLERLRTRSASEDTNDSNQGKNIFGVTKHSSLASQNRRPSSIAEQAMRKMNDNNSLIECNAIQQQPMLSSVDCGEASNVTMGQPMIRPILRIADTKVQDFQPMHLQNLTSQTLAEPNNQQLALNPFFIPNIEPRAFQHSGKDSGRLPKHVRIIL